MSWPHHVRAQTGREEQAWLIPRRATTRPIPISEHSRVLIAMHKAMRADSTFEDDALRPLGVIQDRVWEPRFARLMAPLYQSTQT